MQVQVGTQVQEVQIDEKIFDEVENLWLLEDDDTEHCVPRPAGSFMRFFVKCCRCHRTSSQDLLLCRLNIFPEPRNDGPTYIKAINKHMQTRQVAKVTNNINYLEDQIAKTSIAEMRGVYTIIEQTKNKMVAEASPDYTSSQSALACCLKRKVNPDAL